MELHLIIDEDKDLAGQICRQLGDAIRSGRLAAGEQVPPSRLLAAQLGVSRKTVGQAYAKMILGGLLAGKPGAGTFVQAMATQPQGQPFGLLDIAGGATVDRWLQRTVPQRPSSPDQCPQYDFIGGAARNRFPQAAWRACVLYGLRQSAAARGYYGAPEGVLALRAAIARHAAYSRGVRCDAADVVVTNGAQQALDLIGRVLLEPGAAVAVEDPGYPPARLLFASMGAKIHCIPVDDQGMQVDLIPDGTRLIYVTPAHQFPLGMPMSMGRREALLARARQLGAVIIEDDYDSEFRYQGRPADSLQSMDRSGLVAFVGTFSKIMQPELRIGYMIAPPALLPAVVVARQLGDWHAPTTMQWALAKFIDDGLLQKHIRRSSVVYAARRARLLARLADDLSPWLRAVPATAGFHLSAVCVKPVDIDLLIRLARRMDLGIYPLAHFFQTAASLQGLFFGYGAIELLDIDPALDCLKSLLQEIA